MKSQDITLRIGRNLRLIRQLNDITQAELARELGLSFQQIQKYENGSNRISAALIYELAQICNCRIGDFFAGLPDRRIKGGIRSWMEDVSQWMQRSAVIARLLRLLIKIPPERHPDFLNLVEKMAMAYRE